METHKEKKSRKYDEPQADWNPGDCLKLIRTAYSSDQETLRPGTIYYLKEISDGKNYVIVQLNEGYTNISNEPKSLNLSQEVEREFLITSELHENNFYEDEYTGEIYLPSSFLQKVDCETGEIISDAPVPRSVPLKKAITSAAQLTQKKYAIITTSLEELERKKGNPYLKVGNAFVMDENNRSKLLLFEIVEVLNETDSIKTVSPIDDKTKIYHVPNKYITPFTAIIGQNFYYSANKIKVTVMSIDPDNNNFIVKVNRTGEYLSINQRELIGIKEQDSRQEMSYFYTSTVNEPITDINDLKHNCLEISQEKKDFCRSDRITKVTNFGPLKFQISDDCYIEYIKDTSEDTIYIEKFMCSGEDKGTGRDLFCDFLCYIINNPKMSRIKYIRLIAQPHYVSTVPPSPKLRKILQKMLNDLYRLLRFKKIDVDNEFMGCISELIQPCLRTITFTRQEEIQERFLNDMQNTDGLQLNIRVSFPSFFNMNVLPTRAGGSKSKKRKSKKQVNRRKSIKKTKRRRTQRKRK